MKLIDYNEKKHCFLVLNSETSEIIDIPYYLRDIDSKEVLFKENPEDYEFRIFHKKNFKENEIYQVLEKSINERIGWIFPISSIVSTSHDYTNNPHYCRYAFVAHMLLILYEISESDIASMSFDEIISKKYIEKDAIIFIYEKKQIEKISKFKIDNYYANFYQYGYYLKANYFNPNIINPKSGGKIFIQPISTHLTENDYFYKFFHQLCFEIHPIVKFHVLYQVIELLIEDILIYSLEQLIIQFKEKKIYTRSLRERITKVESEKDRINIMIRWCKISHDDYIELHDSCAFFLTSKGREEEDFPESLYAFRNFIVHDFRNMTEDNSTIIEINYLFELFVLDLIISYKH